VSRSRGAPSSASRCEDSLDAQRVEPIVSREKGTDPEHEVLQADSVGLALLVVLETWRKIVGIDLLADPDRLSRLDLAILKD